MELSFPPPICARPGMVSRRAPVPKNKGCPVNQETGQGQGRASSQPHTRKGLSGEDGALKG